MKIRLGQLRQIINEVLTEVRNGTKVLVGSEELVLDTKSDPAWVTLKSPDGVSVARQSKVSSGRSYQQGTNPDYKGRESYPLEYFNNSTGEWVVYDSNAHKNQILDQTFLNRTLLGRY